LWVESGRPKDKETSIFKSVHLLAKHTVHLTTVEGVEHTVILGNSQIYVIFPLASLLLKIFYMPQIVQTRGRLLKEPPDATLVKIEHQDMHGAHKYQLTGCFER
jgi:hypothetical protein